MSSSPACRYQAANDKVQQKRRVLVSDQYPAGCIYWKRGGSDKPKRTTSSPVMVLMEQFPVTRLLGMTQVISYQ